MRFKISILYIISGLLFASSVVANDEAVLSINGAVNQPLSLGMGDLKNFQSTEVRINDIKRDGTFQGIFDCRGVSLKTLLTVADIEKKEADFKKEVDLAVVIKNRNGKKITLSWGEVFYKNPGEIVIAFASTPIMPHKGKGHFSDKDAYDGMMETLSREVSHPRLVVGGDLFSDRSLESVSEISVVDLNPKVRGKKSPTVFSEQFHIVQNGKPGKVFTDLPEGFHDTVELHIVGEGRGYHGTHQIRGVAFMDILEPYKPDFTLNTVFIISAPDAYRSLLSYGEVFINPHGERIIITDQVDNTPIKGNGGRFILHLPDDLMADREVKAVSKIEILNLD